MHSLFKFDGVRNPTRNPYRFRTDLMTLVLARVTYHSSAITEFLDAQACIRQVFRSGRIRRGEDSSTAQVHQDQEGLFRHCASISMIHDFRRLSRLLQMENEDKHSSVVLYRTPYPMYPDPIHEPALSDIKNPKSIIERLVVHS